MGVRHVVRVRAPRRSRRVDELIRIPAIARGDLFFLREAAEDRDPRVREAAREQIEAVSD